MAWVDEEILVARNPPTKREANDVITFLTRRAKPRFYADENFPRQAVLVLRQMGAKVVTAEEASRIRHPDDNHAAYALKNGLILLTCDRDFLDNRRFPLIHSPAVFVFAFGNGTVLEMRKAFRCLATVFMAPQFFDKWCKVDASKGSWVELCRYQNGATSRCRFRIWRGRIQEWVDE